MKRFLSLFAVVSSTTMYLNEYKNETIYSNLPVNSQNIPKDCKIWQNGCTTCGVNNGTEGMCSMVVCEFSKCLPYCSQYEDATKIPDNCEVWFDGCNTVELSKNVTYVEQDGVKYPQINYVFDQNSTVTPFMCSPLAYQNPSCMKSRNCMVDITEQDYIENKYLI